MNKRPYPEFPHLYANNNRYPTTSDLANLTACILASVKVLLEEMSGQPSKQWLKTCEVGKLLGLSPGTLQTLRNNGTLPFTRIGGVVYYNTEAITKMLEQHKVNSRIP